MERLPDTTETPAWGHPNFKVGGRTFAVLEYYQERLCLDVHVGAEKQEELLRDPRFFRPPYVGDRGWVGLHVDVPFEWDEIERLVAFAHRSLHAPRAPGSRSKRAVRRSRR